MRSRSSMLYHPLVTSHEALGGYPQPCVMREYERRVDMFKGKELRVPDAEDLMIRVVELMRDVLAAPNKSAFPLLWDHPGIEERYNAHVNYMLHRKSIIESYAPLRIHQSLFQAAFSVDWLHPEFRATLEEDGNIADIATLVSPRIYCFPLLSDAFCDMLLEELDAFSESGLPAGRPNSMNRYGLVLTQIGMEPMLTALQRQYLQRIARPLFPIEGDCLDAHHSFTVQYALGEDLGLDMHTDASDVTLNVCLRDTFTGGRLNFCGFREPGSAERQHSHSHEHKRGYALLHLGRQRHGAQDLSSGRRCNLIMWSFNGRYRMSEEYEVTTRRQPEQEPPDPVCLSFTHDSDYTKFKELPEGVAPAAKCACGKDH